MYTYQKIALIIQICHLEKLWLTSFIIELSLRSNIYHYNDWCLEEALSWIKKKYMSYGMKSTNPDLFNTM